MNVPKLGKALAIGIGGTLDFIAGVQTRAPKIVQKVNLEWLWRLGTNPKRLFKRYAENICFFGYILFKQTMMKRAPWISNKLTPEAIDLSKIDELISCLVTYKDISSSEFSQAKVLQKFSSLAQNKNIVVDLEGRNWLNSVELGTIACLCAQAHKTQRGFTMINLSKRINMYFEFYRLKDYFNVQDSAEGVYNSLADFNKLPKEIEIIDEEGKLKIVLPYELTVHNIAKLEEFMDKRLPEIGGDKSLEIDDSKCGFMDSAGTYAVKQLKIKN
jgi:N-acetylglucosaminyldiphosphoundecaprenol N-acetyl-beta-D-mannosaminyltransferase